MSRSRAASGRLGPRVGRHFTDRRTRAVWVACFRGVALPGVRRVRRSRRDYFALHDCVRTDHGVLPRSTTSDKPGSPVELDGGHPGVAPQQAAAERTHMIDNSGEDRSADPEVADIQLCGHAPESPRGYRVQIPRRWLPSN